MWTGEKKRRAVFVERKKRVSNKFRDEFQGRIKEQVAKRDRKRARELNVMSKMGWSVPVILTC